MRKTDMMRVGMYYSNSDVRVEEMPIPQIGPGELLVRVEACGICGSDCMEWYRINKVPLVLGHEIGGEIVEVGQGVRQYKAGDRISASHHVPCNTCHYCLAGHQTVCDTLRQTHFDPGGFAEYLRLPAINVDRGVYLLPDEVSFEEATFIEPLACVLRGQRLARIQLGLSVLVMGSGMAGLLHIHLARVTGATPIIATDIVDYRLMQALQFGADWTFSANEDIPTRLQEINDGKLVDVVIICTGVTTAFAQALQSVKRGGTVLFFAPINQGVTMPFSVNDIFWRNEITLISSYAGDRADHVWALELIRSHRVAVKEMITHRLPLAQAQSGFQLVACAKESMKVIIEPQR
ncbi:MAG: zinc-dependent dehydrogenase [bacterium]|nr:zinc-dependent dehydrogenase [bacterium]